ncbi:helix-turn-helix domain-containing protein [Streptomyces ardesiacus]|uniref:helix-turn-helix domain-containing protein n=1 Tax=Streptomyces ardesiacus TaxID=285564 RepID=UPI003F656331
MRTQTNAGGGRRRSDRRAPSRVPRSQRAELAAKLKAEYEATKQTISTLATRHGLGYPLVSALLHEAGADIRLGPNSLRPPS